MERLPESIDYMQVQPTSANPSAHSVGKRKPSIHIILDGNSSAEQLLNGGNSPQNIRSDELCSLADQQQAESTGVISPLGHSLRTRAPVQGPAQGEIFYTKELPLTMKSIPNQQINYPK